MTEIVGLGPQLASLANVMATGDHNITSSENSEISSKPTLKKQTV